MSMEQIRRNWMYDYIRTSRDNSCIKCRMCGLFYPIHRRTDHLKNHILFRHRESYCYAHELHGTNFNWKQYFYTIQDDDAKCNLCDKVYCHYKISVSLGIRKHLKIIHNVDKYIAKELRQWLRSYVSINLDVRSIHFGKTRCRICNIIFRDNNSLNLMKHMRDIHRMDVPRIRLM